MGNRHSAAKPIGACVVRLKAAVILHHVPSAVDISMAHFACLQLTERSQSNRRVRIDAQHILTPHRRLLTRSGTPIFREKVHCQLGLGYSKTYNTDKIRVKTTGGLEWDNEFRFDIVESSVPIWISCFSESSYVGVAGIVPTFGSVAPRKLPA